MGNILLNLEPLNSSPPGWQASWTDQLIKHDPSPLPSPDDQKSDIIPPISSRTTQGQELLMLHYITHLMKKLLLKM